MNTYPTVPLPVSTHDIELMTVHLDNVSTETNRALWWAKTINSEAAESLELDRKINAVRSLLLVAGEMTAEIITTIQKRRHGSQGL